MPIKKPLQGERGFFITYRFLENLSLCLIGFQVAGRLGFEPRLTESESVVLPLDDLPKVTFDYTYFFLGVKQKPEPGKFVKDIGLHRFANKRFRKTDSRDWIIPVPVCIILIKPKNHLLLIFI